MRRIDADAFFEDLTADASPCMFWDAKEIKSKLDEMPALDSEGYRLSGCEYCNGNSGFIKRLGAFYITRNSEWYLNTAHCKPRQIYFCPICGRELRGETNGARNT